MRIAIFSDNFYPELSGISDSIISTAKELAARGHIINFYVPSHPKRNFELLGHPLREIDLGPNIKVKRLWSVGYRTGTGQGRALILTGLRWMALRKFKPDIIHAHLPFGAGIEALIAAKILNKPFIGTNHTPMTEFIRYSPIKFGQLNKWLLKYTVWFYNRCNFVSSPAQTVVDEMIANGFKQPYKILSNPIDTKTFSVVGAEEKKYLKQKFGFSEHTILYAGRLAAEKRIDLVMYSVAKLIKEIPDLMYVILGRGTQQKSLENLAAKLGIAKHVKILGFINDPKTYAEIYKASDLFAMLSTAESQSMVTMQAMSCGIPVIVSNVWGLGEYVNSDRGILINRGEEELLTGHISKLFNNPEHMDALGAAGRKYVQEFSPEKIAAQWDNLYTQAIRDFGAKKS